MISHEPLGDAQVIKFLHQAIGSAHIDRRAGLESMVTALEKGQQLQWPRELLGHPLFLQMIAEATSGQTGTASRVETITEWVERKIARDLSVQRLAPGKIVDRSAFVDLMMTVMEKCGWSDDPKSRRSK